MSEFLKGASLSSPATSDWQISYTKTPREVNEVEWFENCITNVQKWIVAGEGYTPLTDNLLLLDIGCIMAMQARSPCTQVVTRSILTLFNQIAIKYNLLTRHLLSETLSHRPTAEEAIKLRHWQRYSTRLHFVTMRLISQYNLATQQERVYVANGRWF